MSAARRNTLGRGLSALLGDEQKPAASSSDVESSTGAKFLPIGDLHPGKYQPRHVMDADAINELAASIAEKGVLQPLLVRTHPTIEGGFEIIAGERRWRASQQASLHEVPVIIKELSDVEALEVGLIENLQRQDLSPIEEAQGYQRLMDEFSHTQELMAGVVGKSRSHVANTLRLLNLPISVRDMVEDGTLSAGHARALLTSDDAENLAKKIAREGLNVRQTEKLVKKPVGVTVASAKKTIAKDSDTVALEDTLGNLLGLKVDISSTAKGGSLTVHYQNLDQLDDVLQRLSHGKSAVEETPIGDGTFAIGQDDVSDS